MAVPSLQLSHAFQFFPQGCSIMECVEIEILQLGYIECEFILDPAPIILDDYTSLSHNGIPLDVTFGVPLDVTFGVGATDLVGEMHLHRVNPVLTHRMAPWASTDAGRSPASRIRDTGTVGRMRGTSSG